MQSPSSWLSASPSNINVFIQAASVARAEPSVERSYRPSSVPQHDAPADVARPVRAGSVELSATPTANRAKPSPAAVRQSVPAPSPVTPETHPTRAAAGAGTRVTTPTAPSQVVADDSTPTASMVVAKVARLSATAAKRSKAAVAKAAADKRKVSNNTSSATQRGTDEPLASAATLRRLGAPAYNRVTELFTCPYCVATLRSAGYRNRGAKIEARRHQREDKSSKRGTESKGVVDDDDDDALPRHCNFCASDRAAGDWLMCRDCDYELCTDCVVELRSDGRYDDPESLICRGCRELTTSAQAEEHLLTCRARRSATTQLRPPPRIVVEVPPPQPQPQHADTPAASSTQGAAPLPHLQDFGDDDDDAFVGPSASHFVMSQPLVPVMVATQITEPSVAALLRASAARAQASGSSGSAGGGQGLPKAVSHRTLTPRGPGSRQAQALASPIPSSRTTTICVRGFPPGTSGQRLAQFLDVMPPAVLTMDAAEGEARIAFPTQMQAWNALLTCTDHAFDGIMLEAFAC